MAKRRRRSNRLLGLPSCRRPGVYCITNTVNGKVYVGSSISIRGRLSGHVTSLRKGVHDNTYLQRSWMKHGEENFSFSVLELCTASLIFIKEQYWMDKLNATDRRFGYNICLEATGGRRGLKFSKSAKAKMSRKRKGIVPVAAIAAAAIANKGRKMSAKVCRDRSIRLKGKPKSKEHRANLVANHWTKRYPTEVVKAKQAAGARACHSLFTKEEMSERMRLLAVKRWRTA